MKVKDFIESYIFKYNLDILLTYISLAVIYIYKITGFNLPPLESTLLLSANVAGVSIVYLYNKITDKEEDAVNGIHFNFDVEKKLNTIIIIFFVYASVVYLSFLDPLLIIQGAMLFAIGILYSHKKTRLKEISIIKNLIPSASWYLSLVIFLTVLYSNDFLSTFLLLLPLFVFLFLFEIIWDIPDLEGDKKNNIRTLPVIFGIRSTKIFVSFSLLILFLSTSSIINKITTVILLLFLLHIKNNASKTDYHYFLLLLLSFLIFLNFFLL